jgi:transcriptional regulator with XRE-family HTH domain
MSAPLIPTTRFGDVLRDAREHSGRSLDDLSEAAEQLTVTRLQAIEDGRAQVDEDLVVTLAELYGVEATDLAAHRGELVIDLDRGTVSAGGAERSLPVHGDEHVLDASGPEGSEILTRYLSLVHALRGIEPGTPFPIRQLDVAVLGEALSWRQERVERELVQLMLDDTREIEHRTRSLRRRLIVPAAGVLVAATAVGALVFVRASNDGSPAPSSTNPAVVPAGEVDLGPPPLVLERDPETGEISQVSPGD